jgi:hypothetical protein
VLAIIRHPLMALPGSHLNAPTQQLSNMELTKQQQRIFSALKDGNAALKAAQAQVRARGGGHGASGAGAAAARGTSRLGRLLACSGASASVGPSCARLSCPCC